MKFIYGILILTILTSSCTTYQASVRKHDKLNYETIRVYPEWEYKDPKGKKWIAPLIGLSAGAIYGFQTEFTYDGKTYREVENAAIWGGAGLLTGAVVSSVLFPKRRLNSQKFDLSQSEKWLSSFNKVTGNNYVISRKELNKTLILAPEDRIMTIRENYKSLEADLESSNPSISFESLQGWKSKLDGEYSILPLSEINHINNFITNHETKIASIELTSKIPSIDLIRDNYASLTTLLQIKDSNYDLYSNADNKSQNEFDVAIDKKLGTILSSLMSDEIKTINRIDNDLAGLSKVNAYLSEFNRKYAKVKDNQKIKDVYLAINEKIRTIINSNSSEIKSQIGNFDDLKQLNEFEKNYYSNINSNVAELNELKNSISSKRKEIIDEQNRKRIAEESINQKRIVEAKRVIYERERLASQRAQVIKKKRQLLNQKYGTYFPSIVDLHKMLVLVPTIKERFLVSDKEKFLQEFSSKGYYLFDRLAEINGDQPNPRLHSDKNRFRNNLGSRIETYRSVLNNKLLASVRCFFPNAPSDIIELYALELASEYRKRLDTNVEFHNGKIKIVNESAHYINSGSTIYSYEIDNGELEVIAFYNFDGTANIITERLGTNSLKVNSYSNLTDIFLKKGQSIKINASGSIRLGVFAGKASPNGINGFDLYSRVSRFKHGSLIGRIGEGDWFYIGSSNTIVAPESGRLELRINDIELDNNEGYFIVTYDIQ